MDNKCTYQPKWDPMGFDHHSQVEISKPLPHGAGHVAQQLQQRPAAACHADERHLLQHGAQEAFVGPEADGLLQGPAPKKEKDIWNPGLGLEKGHPSNPRNLGSCCQFA